MNNTVDTLSLTTLIVGDLHLKQEYVLPQVEQNMLDSRFFPWLPHRVTFARILAH